MVLSMKCILFLSLTLLISVVYAQSEYGENYEYYEEPEEPTDSEYYYGDYGEDESDSLEKTTTEDPYRSR